MTSPKAKREKRVIEKEIEIAAPVEAVWKALTQSEELKRWFPLDAQVTPGEGGKITLSWGPGYEGIAPIEVWEENHRLRTVDSSSGQPVSVEWTIESRGGKTVLRIVQSSFASGANWENEFYDSTNYGWGFMLLNLRHYLEHHAGQPRLVAWSRRKVEMTREAIYEKLGGRQGIFAEGVRGNLQAGSRYSLAAATGETWKGRVEFVVPPRGFCVVVESLNDALAWLTIEGSAPEHDAQIWFSTYGLPQEQVTKLEAHWNGELERILG
jgi:uncharacterized protein YndB with AHSA1/START domain